MDFSWSTVKDLVPDDPVIDNAVKGCVESQVMAEVIDAALPAAAQDRQRRSKSTRTSHEAC